ncbi:MAG TPA: FecR domain-containing protein [Verrucomicrobiota bacterium]|nr:hypothetical protein [Verrucomicrobiales bacterium]HRI11576.1 FecR domain-containing protein [Verrucomicrobiota bacterium]
MNEERYQNLLAKLLDDELEADEASEFTGWLKESPAARVEAERQLFLWDLYAQQHSSERGAEAFAAACQTRIAAAAGEHAFMQGIQGRLRSGAKRSSRREETLTSFPNRSKDADGVSLVTSATTRIRWVFRQALGRSGRILALAASIAIVIGLSLWLFPATHNEPTLSFPAGTQVALERAGQSLPASDGLKLLPGDLLRVTGTNDAALHYGNEATRITFTGPVDLKILAWNQGKRFQLRQGQIEATVARQRPLRPMILTTAQAEARVLGTRFTLGATTNATRLDVTEGKVRFTRTSDDTLVKVAAGHYAVAASNYELAALPLTGGLFREYWTNVAGDSWTVLITHTNYPGRPDGSGYLTNLTRLEMPPNGDTNYGERLRGYVHPPTTGEYTFWIAAQADAALWLSPDEDPENQVMMAYSFDSPPRDWEANASQQSATVPLIAGKRYCLEVLHKVGGTEGHLAVAWQGPGREREVIPLQFLSPFKPPGGEKKP